ncbi:MAG: anhydro-N-acetylmuramic acid kinase [Phycisphaerales bacterium]|nr:anhydro-N-acetylmuramic acid kinase [Phycisphaerales bacterium]
MNVPVDAPGRHRRIVGCMSGTSLDGIDAALVDVRGGGPSLVARLVAHASVPLGDLGPRLRAVADGAPHTAAEIAALARDLALLHVDVIRMVLPDDGSIDLVATHGQTVHHVPPLSWQLLTPAVIADALDCTVVSDLRAADLAAGGQGAPITPIADAVLFGHDTECRTIVNLGGFCNITRLQGRAVERGHDVCLCNQLLDGLARRRLGTPYDADGAVASAGAIVIDVYERLVGLLRRQAACGRSLGTGDPARTFIEAVSSVDAPEDALHTAAGAIAEVVVESVGDTDRMVLAGGGARNATLVDLIARRATAPVIITDALGVPAQAREAAAMAVLGALSADGVPITGAATTGVREPAPISGAWVHR